MEIPFQQTITFPTPFEGFGSALAWWAHVLGQALGANQETKEAVDSILQAFFGPHSKGGLDLSYIRYNAGAQTGMVQPGQFRPGGTIPAGWDNDTAQKAVLARIQQIKEDRPWILELFSNSPPQNLTISGNSAGNTTQKADNITPQNIPAFCTYLLDFYEQMCKAGYNPTILSPMNEPSMTAWVAGNNQEGAYWTHGMRRTLMQELRTQIALRAQTSPIFSQLVLAVQEENNIADALMAETACDLSTPNHDTEYHVHTYTSAQFSDNFLAKFIASPFQDSNASRTMLANMVRGRHKKFVVSEFGLGGNMLPGDIRDPLHAFAIVERVCKDLVTLQCERWAYWQPIENVGSNWGFTQCDFNKLLAACRGQGTFTKADIMYGGQYYGFREVTRILPPGTTSFQLWAQDNRSAIKSDVGLLLLNKTPQPWIVKVTPGWYDANSCIGSQASSEVLNVEGGAVSVPPMAVYSLIPHKD